MRHLALILLITACASVPSPAPPARVPRSALDDKTAKLQKLDGLFPLYWDEENGKLLMQINRLGEEFLYQVSLPAGVGSNPIGLDRGELGQTHIVRFDRIGPKILLIEPNYRYRAATARSPATPTNDAPWRNPSRDRCSGHSKLRRAMGRRCSSMQPISS